MKRYLQIGFLLLMLLLSLATQAQQGQNSKAGLPVGPNETELKEHFLQHHPDGKGWEEFISARKKDFLNTGAQNLKQPLPPPIINTGCTNIDFENGTTSGWTASTGFNPAYNTAGCCLTAGGAQVITSGAGTDPCGGFPVVAPGGSFSLMLGDNGTGGIADRIEQSFVVSASQTFFSYRYAVVLQDPGHTTTDQPSFQIEMLDSNGTQLPCAQYQVSAGQGIPGFQNSSTCAGVVFKPWTTVTLDLSGYVGQTVTIRFTTYDCALGGHFGYAYLDGSCLQYNTSVNDTICNNSTLTLYGFPGAGSYLWSGPGVSGATTSSVVVNNAGSYSVQSSSVSGCPLPNINYQLSNIPAPVASFVASNTISCNNTVSFVNTSNYNGSSAGSSFWSFGDGTTSMMDNPSHTFPGPGSYQVQLIAFSTNGCSDTTTQIIQIMFPMSCSFTYNANCAQAAAQFTDNSYVAGGTVNSWYWNFGDGTSSSQQNPLHVFSVAGTYNVILNVTTSNGCAGSDTIAVTINPVPQTSFNATQVCAGNATQFTDASTIASGSITGYAWDFDANGVTDNTNQNPQWMFPAAGTMNVILTATSNNGCTSSFSAPVTVYPQPFAGFNAANACEGVSNAFINTSTIPSPGIITSYQWNFGDGSTSPLMSPSHLYTSPGQYNVTLTASSAQGCVGTHSAVVTVYPAPLAAFNASPVCEGNSTQFNNTSSIASGTITGYAWDFTNDGSSDNNAANPLFLYSSDGTFTAELTVVSNNNCIATTTQTVIVYPAPEMDFSASSSCFGLPTQFADVITVSSGSIMARHWDFESDGTIDFNGSNPSHIYGTTGTKNPTLYAWTDHYCAGAIQKTIFVNTVPQVNFSVNDPEGCPEHCVAFYNSSYVTNGSIVQYEWNFGDNSALDNSVVPQHCFSSGTYDVTLKAVSDSGCVSSFTYPAMITVYPEPDAGFTWNPNQPDVLEPLITVVDNSQGAQNWSYDFGDGTGANDANPQHVFNTDQPTQFTITQIVWNSYGCYDTVQGTVEIKPGYSLYIPNAFTPVNQDGINDYFKAEGIGVTEFKMWVYDRWGNQIFFTENINEGWDGKVADGHSHERAQMDVYVWKVQAKDLNDKVYKLTGHVTLVK